jgi:cytochrome c oxidase subunit 2
VPDQDVADLVDWDILLLEVGCLSVDLVSNELFWYCRGLVASTSGDLRLLTVHSGVAIASSVVYRVQLGSSDVIHSFALPALGIKADVLPGRINSVILVCLNSGLLLGQCSELCGSYHGFMPLTLVLAA